MERKRTYAVDLDDAHVVPIDPEEERGERARVHDPQAVRPAGLERQRRVLVEPDRAGDGVRARPRDGAQVGSVLGKVDERRVYTEVSEGQRWEEERRTDLVRARHRRGWRC